MGTVVHGDGSFDPGGPWGRWSMGTVPLTQAVHGDSSFGSGGPRGGPWGRSLGSVVHGPGDKGTVPMLLFSQGEDISRRP